MAQSPFVAQSAWPTRANFIPSVPPDSQQSQLVSTTNALLTALQRVLALLGGADVPGTTATLSIGTTVTLAISASVIWIDGVYAAVAAQTAQALGALGTIPNGTWGLIVAERVAAGTTTFVSAAANYTTGYATEALALAAMPAQTAAKVVVGWVTVQSTAQAAGWIAGTDAFAGGTGGTNPAANTNYYSNPGAADQASWSSVKQITVAGTLVP